MRIRRAFFFAAVSALAIGGASISDAQTPRGAPNKPPVAQVRPVTDEYYGTMIVDNYRYLENLNDPEVQEWFKNQNDYARAMLSSIPRRDTLLAQIRELDQSDPAVVFGVRQCPGDLYFYREALAGENGDKLYLRRGLRGEEKLLVDPDKISVTTSSREKGNNDLARFAVSQDCKHVAVSITPGGSENDAEIHVIDVASGQETGDVILRALGGVSGWLPDNRSFTYSRLQAAAPGMSREDLRQKRRIYLHTLGTNPRNDPAVFGYGVVSSIDVAASHSAWVYTSPGSRHAVGEISAGVSPESFYYIEPAEALGKSNTAWRKFADTSDKITEVAVHGDDLYLLTFKNSSRYKIIRTDARNPRVASAEVVVPPSEAVVTEMRAARDALYVQVLDGGINRILRVPYGPKPRVENLVLPMHGSAKLIDSDPRVPGILFYLTSWTTELEIYAYDPSTKRVTNTKLEQLGRYSHDDNIESVDVKVKSYDGTLVPLSIVFPKGLKLDGSHPTTLSGYGAYGSVASSPDFDSREIIWEERGGVSATCGVRGGGEYGEEWHLAGKGPTKPNSWRDFIACAEYLIDKKYTSPAHLAAEGRSAGGIVIGRAFTERPDLFAAAIVEVGVLDLLRNETTANGAANIPEFGSTKTEDGFKALLAMSAYQHIADHMPYPAVLFEVGINDPRVDPWESAKMTARLQAATSSGRPVLLRVNYSGGHGLGGGLQEYQESAADVCSFLLWQLGASDFQPNGGTH